MNRESSQMKRGRGGRNQKAQLLEKGGHKQQSSLGAIERGENHQAGRVRNLGINTATGCEGGGVGGGQGLSWVCCQFCRKDWEVRKEERPGHVN